MWFKNLRIYRLPAHWSMTAQVLEQALATQPFTPCQSLETVSVGWVPSAPNFGDQLVFQSQYQMLIALAVQKKLLPSSVVADALRERASQVEAEQGFRPGRKQLKELKDEVIDTLLPRAFVTTSHVRAWIDPIRGWLVVDTASSSKADLVVKMLLKCIEKLPLETLHLAKSIGQEMTEWIAQDEAPFGFTVDQDTELQSRTEGKAAVIYKRHTLEAEDLRRHIAAGKQVKKLAMTWNDRVSFVMHDDSTIRRITPLDVLKETANQSEAQNAQERFESDFVLMTGELGKLLNDVLHALGGEAPREAVAA